MMYFQIKRGNVLIYSVWFSPCKITPLDQIIRKHLQTIPAWPKRQNKKHSDIAVQFVVRVSESDINEADFSAVLSPSYFDLLDSHLLGWPVCLQSGERKEGGGRNGGREAEAGMNHPVSRLVPPRQSHLSSTFPG